MKTNSALSSVIIPVFNGERFLEEAICSVIEQSYKPVELIIVDDGSNDGTVDIIKKYEKYLRSHSQVNQGQVYAMNTGLTLAEGQYVSFLDSDDLLLKDKLLHHISFMEMKKEVDILISKMEIFYDKTFQNNIHVEEEGYNLSCATIRRSAFDSVGKFDIQYKHAKEMEWLIRARSCGKIIKMDDEIVLRRRLHDKNMSYDVTMRKREMMQVLRRKLPR